MKERPVIIYGNNQVARLVFDESKRTDSNFHVSAFCVGDDFLQDDIFCGLPLIAESEIVRKYPPSQYDMLSCIDAPSKLRNRLLVYDRLKNMGYSLRNYISPLANVSERVNLGENNIVYAFAHICMDTCLGHSNIIRSTALIGHDNIIGNGNSVCEGAVTGGSANIGDSCWLGLNCTVNNDLTIANDTLVASGAVIMSNTEQGTSYIGNPAKAFFSHKDTGIMMNFSQRK